MKEVTLPDTPDSPGGGIAHFRERGIDSFPGRSVKLLRAAGLAAASQFEGIELVLEDGPEGETDEEREERYSKALGEANQNRLTVGQVTALFDAREAAVVATLVSWTLNRPLPTIANIGDLDGDLYDALLESVGGVGGVEASANFTPKPWKGNENPTDDCESSGTGSPETPQSNPTLTSLTDTAPTSGESSSLEQ